jgi:hypothetical protein
MGLTAPFLTTAMKGLALKHDTRAVMKGPATNPVSTNMWQFYQSAIQRVRTLN